VLQDGKIQAFGYSAAVLARLNEPSRVVAFPAGESRQVSA
jgi:hypothetical protein